MNSDARSARLLLALVATHFLVDAIASVINPLWPTLQTQTASSNTEFLWLLVAWNLSTSAAQMAFGVFGDRFHGRWLIWAGPAVAVCCLSALGLTTSLPLLCLLVSVAGLGIAAFHPEAASLAGNTLPARRSRAISLFQLGGFLGQTVGPMYSGFVVHRWGMEALLPGVLWTLGLILVTGVVTRSRKGDATNSPFDPRENGPIRWQTQATGLGMLLLIGVLRIIPAAGVPMALAFLESDRSGSTFHIGFIQSAFTFGIGGGGLICGLFLAHRHEERVLWLLPLVAAPVLWIIPATSGAALFATCVAAGLLIGSTMPILISLGQQLMPHSPRVGSSITMGLSWGLGGGLASLIVMVLKPYGQIELAFPLFATLAVASSVCCVWLPKSPAVACA
jgi:FSR family fosmidomycin resistance protein-like MFS transporter